MTTKERKVKVFSMNQEAYDRSKFIGRLVFIFATPEYDKVIFPVDVAGGADERNLVVRPSDFGEDVARLTKFYASESLDDWFVRSLKIGVLEQMVGNVPLKAFHPNGMVRLAVPSIDHAHHLVMTIRKGA